MGRPGGESFRRGRVGRGEHGRPRRNALLGQSVMHVKRCQQSKARMMVLGVVPGEELVAVRPRILAPGQGSSWKLRDGCGRSRMMRTDPMGPSTPFTNRERSASSKGGGPTGMATAVRVTPTMRTTWRCHAGLPNLEPRSRRSERGVERSEALPSAVDLLVGARLRAPSSSSRASQVIRGAGRTSGVPARSNPSGTASATSTT